MNANSINKLFDVDKANVLLLIFADVFMLNCVENSSMKARLFTPLAPYVKSSFCSTTDILVYVLCLYILYNR
jgi:hypothetical protein